MNHYIQGNAAKADQIRAAFERLGIDTSGYNFGNDNFLFFTYDLVGEGKVITTTNVLHYFANIIKTHPDYKELELPVEPKFKVGDWLVYKDYGTFCGGLRTVQVQTVERNMYVFTHGTNSVHRFIDSECRLWTIQDAKDGDVLTTDNGWTCIFQAFDGYLFSSYCFMDSQKWFCEVGSEGHTLDSRINGNIHPATKEQRDLLFTKMKEAGYQWDEKKKELRNIIKPKFKVGDDIKTGNTIDTIAEVDLTTRSYYCESGRTISFENQDLWHLAPKPHYDIKNFKPFDKVLVRDSDDTKWRCNWFSHYSGEGGVYRFVTTKCGYAQYIPFNDITKHLLGTTDMPSEEYINW